MSVSITLQQTNSTYNDDDEQPVYKVANEITASEGISLALFVFAVEDDSFNHVATTRDIEAYPESRAEAVADGDAYYRISSAVREYETLADAQEFALSVRSRLNRLSVDYPAAQDAFIGTETYVYET